MFVEETMSMNRCEFMSYSFIMIFNQLYVWQTKNQDKF